MSIRRGIEVPEMLNLARLAPPDSESARYRWPVVSPYVERYWLPSLGPTGILLLRWLSEFLEDGIWSVELDGLRQGLGLGKMDPLFGCLERLDRFEMLQWQPALGQVAVLERLPWLGSNALGRLPPILLERHEALRSEEM